MLQVYRLNYHYAVIEYLKYDSIDLYIRSYSLIFIANFNKLPGNVVDSSAEHVRLNDMLGIRFKKTGDDIPLVGGQQTLTVR